VVSPPYSIYVGEDKHESECVKVIVTSNGWYYFLHEYDWLHWLQLLM